MADIDPAHRLKIGRAFSPAVPVRTKDVFAGRRQQLDRIIDIVSTGGQHALIYGERGVGKTSLARVINDVFSSNADLPFFAAYYTCDSEDDYARVWRGLLHELVITQTKVGIGFSQALSSESTTALSVLGDEQPTPNNIRQVLNRLTDRVHLVLFVDEFDRPTDGAIQRLMADTIKIMSDQAVNATVVLIGVGETVQDIMKGHESVHRSLVEIQMPLMERAELEEIVITGMRAAEMEVDPEFATLVAEFSLGLPHYAHLLGQQGAYAALDAGRLNVGKADFAVAVEKALANASQSIRETYTHATGSNRETLYEQVLLACARAPKDALGMFGAADVREQLRRITKRDYEIPAFAHHLNDFSSSTPPRGGVLVKRGTLSRFRYKFADPLMPPYVLLKGHRVAT